MGTEGGEGAESENQVSHRARVMHKKRRRHDETQSVEPQDLPQSTPRQKNNKKTNILAVRVPRQMPDPRPVSPDTY